MKNLVRSKTSQTYMERIKIKKKLNTYFTHIKIIPIPIPIQIGGLYLSNALD